MLIYRGRFVVHRVLAVLAAERSHDKRGEAGADVTSLPYIKKKTAPLSDFPPNRLYYIVIQTAETSERAPDR